MAQDLGHLSTNDTAADINSSATQENDVGKTLLAALGMLGRCKGTMPLRSFSNIPLFRDNRLNAFLDRYNAVADDFEIPDEGRVKGLFYYLAEDPHKNILQYVKCLPEWESRDWSGLQVILRRTFPDDARNVVIYSVEDLRKVVNSDKPLQDLQQLAPLAPHLPARISIWAGVCKYPVCRQITAVHL